MASSKEIQHSSRPSQGRLPSLSTNSSSSYPRQSHTRNHSHSVSAGSLIPSSRVSRRKSVSSNVASNVNALLAAATASEVGDNPLAMPISTRRATMRSGPMGSLPSPPSSLPTHRIRLTMKSGRGESAIDDDNNDEEMEDEEDDEFTKNRMRRASEGSQLLKDGKKANANDLKCDKCGKGYKHSSCLSKHLWEHTPQWSYTSKLLISKHQQVQLLEAAAVLLGMNQESVNTPPDSAKDPQSDDQDSASSLSDHEIDRASSADMTPPPADIRHAYGGSSFNGSRIHAVKSDSYTMSDRVRYGASVPVGFGLFHRQNYERRPPSSGMNENREEETLTTAMENHGLSSDFPDDIPPVPGIPAEYLNDLSGSYTPSLRPRQRESFARGSYDRHQLHGDGDVQMDDGDESMGDEEDYDLRSRGRSDEDDDGVFGHMEE
ncbi:hypothetical protein EAE96_008212 [Botrytis aclada]|nr:hypothetical protein EAE96_008212 [Botrytis aclada]